MLFRNIIGSIFASPVMLASVTVSVVCASVLVLNIATDMGSDYNESVSAKEATVVDVTERNNLSPGNGSDSANNMADHRSKEGQGKRYESGQWSRKPASSNTGLAAERDYTYPRQRAHVDSDGEQKNSDYRDNSNRIEGYSSGYQRLSDSDTGSPSVSNSISFSSGNANTVGASGAVSSGATSRSVSDIQSGVNATTTTTDAGGNFVESEEFSAPENSFPPTLENEVQIDIDERHFISCQPVEVDGPPCMCTYTVVDADGSNSRVEDNCG